MKIGIITLPLHSNYGGILQAYALQKALSALGHQAFVIQPDKQNIPLVKRAIKFSKNTIKWLRGDNVIFNIDELKENASRITRPFVDKHIPLVSKSAIYSDEELRSFDAFVVGSDQIWRPKYYPNIAEAYFSFLPENSTAKRIAYAPSFGTDSWEYSISQAAECKRLIGKFNSLSVREISAVDLCNAHFNVKAEHVLDPTLLIERQTYIDLFQTSNKIHSGGTLFSYILDMNDEKTSAIKHIEKQLNVTSFSPSKPSIKKNVPIELNIEYSVEQWLKAFNDAEFIITDSFHAVVFSIIFNKPFLVWGNVQRGLTRFSSLLRIFDLEDRLVTSAKSVESVVAKKIDWQHVNSLHEKKKNESIQFLQEALN
ncbi:polysaccharide pyruvyl transferase family protein [Dyadobacter fermentans]|uniref:Polysaccharide pyruvyl transferase domain-containing protein n=1 Tax=Dyadobacter fermentans (strain ATCC 700827 / DSM 18053 / CIP 107007 / KCTC 52180 / NS114) TaxID=471854 RepID=C6VUM2_DYAFD|nr:polysaccharide pyruvyl transferase family protein [Dyadobacter fermentans]ACT91331.1 conserved hypothetical protein [Dyadobacter fermentans DSM 18053]